MTEGSVHSIHIAAMASEPTVPVEEVSAVAGQGLEGDRYFTGDGTYSKTPGSGRQVTLIEYETIEALERDYQTRIEPGQARRNIVTRGVALNHLVGREFSAGEVVLRGLRLNEPCNHLAGLTDEKVKQGLVHRGGLRADIVSGGVIRVGDEVRVE
ncbi:MAG: MOSC domain-containing protein [Dehalococcoidia bacterium]|nr:MOSC domain-containing protein [Dehalococcoidia bacterium]